MASLERDENRIPVLGAVSSADGTTVLPLQIDPATNRLLVEATGSIDTIFDVSSGVILQNVAGGSTAYTDDFVIGSSGLNDTGSAAHDSRVIWDKSQSFFAAGIVYGTNWDTASRGFASCAFGEDNKASGDYSSVFGSSHQALGDYQFCGGGFGNILGVGEDSCYAFGDGNTIASTNDNAYTSGAFGNSNDVYGYTSFAFGANHTVGTNVASDVQTGIAMGDSNTVGVNADYSLALGQLAQGKFPGSFTLGYSFVNFSKGSQYTVVTQRFLTTNATPTELTFGGGSPSASNSLVLPASTTWGFRIMVTARQTAGAAGTVGDSAIYEFVGGIKRDGSNNTALVGSVTKTVIAEDQAAWDCDVAADDTNESLDITVTGEASKTIAWCATIQLTEAANN